MKKHIIIFAAITSMTLTACNDFLTKEDPNKIDAPSFFRNETDLKNYANGFIQTMIPSAENIATGDSHSDYMSWRGQWNFLTDKYNADDQGSWSWTQLRNINYFLANFKRANCSDALKKHYEGTARFWRAYFYYNKVKTFGAVPWYDFVLENDDYANLYKERDNREEVMRHVLEDISYAADNCITNAALEVNSVQITKYVALAMKARICLFEGTYRKYHSTDPSTGERWKSDESGRYLRECADACEKLMKSGRYSITNTPSNVETQYRELFTSESVNTSECIWARAYNAALNTTHVLNSKFVVQQYGSYALNKQFINTYLNLDGTRFTDRTDYDKVPFTDEFKNRDHRLAQTVRHPGYKRNNNGTATPQAPNFNCSATGYQPIKWVIDDMGLDSNTSPCNSSIPIIRYAEILLNYAEAKCELGEFTEAIWNQTIRPLRERAGVSGTMPTTADAYMAQYFLNTVTDCNMLEIRRERGIELVMENLRWDDDMRWAMGQLLDRVWYGVYVPAMNQLYDMDGDGTSDVSFVTAEPTPAVKGVQYRIIGSDFKLTEGTSGYLIVYPTLERKWNDKKYLRPIPTTALNSNPALGQNPGWKK